MQFRVKFLALLSTAKITVRATTAFQQINTPPSLILQHRICRRQQDSGNPYFTTTLLQLSARMPRNIKKENLPSKICVVCNRPFTWRKKWEKVWDEVSTCSKSCNRERKSIKQKNNQASTNVVEGINYSSQQDVAFVTTDNAARDVDDLSSDGTSVDLDAMVPQTNSDLDDDDPVSRAKIQRKLAKKLKKAQRRAEREGRGDPTAGQKNCDICTKSVDLLIRCTIDETEQWKMVCGKCWKDVSGGVVDGDHQHPHYRYGGLWKNRRAVTS